jgi:AcrR family transcriptional regulator
VGHLKTKQEVVAEFRSTEILDAARGVFARKGFESATVDDIAEAAHIAKGTVYLYFRSKRDIYLAALKQGAIALNQETKRRMDAVPAAHEKLRAFVDTRIQYFEQNRDFFRIYQSEFGNLFHPAQLNEEFKDLCHGQGKMLETILDQLVREGQLRPMRTDLAAFTIHDMTRGLIFQRLLGWSRASAEEDIDSLFDLIWKGLKP